MSGGQQRICPFKA